MRLYNWEEFSEMYIPDIQAACRKYGITNYTINEDGSIDVNGDVYLSDKNLREIPLKFRNVSGSFKIDRNYLTSLEGSPRKIGLHFFIHSNNLTSLEGGPEEIGLGYYCNDNSLTNLKGLNIDTIEGAFICTDNKLTTLEGSPKEVRGSFNCSHNNLTDLKGSPNIIGSNFYCFKNPNLTTLEGDLKSVGGDFKSSECSLESFKGLPDVWGNMDFAHNKIFSTEGFCEFYRESVSVECYDNPINEILKLFTPPYRFDALYWMEQLQVIRPGKKLDYTLFCTIFDEIGFEAPSLELVEESISSYRII